MKFRGLRRRGSAPSLFPAAEKEVVTRQIWDSDRQLGGSEVRAQCVATASSVQKRPLGASSEGERAAALRDWYAG